MKKIILTSIFAFLLIGVYAQDIDVSEGTKAMREGSFNAYTVELEGASASFIESSWKDFMKDYDAKIKKDKKQNLIVSEAVQMPRIGRTPLDVYVMISEDKSGLKTDFSVWFDTGSGYVNSIDMEVQSESAVEIVTEFATIVLKQVALDNEKAEEEKLKKLNGELKKLESTEDDLRKSISKAQENILKWEKELRQNEDDIAGKKKEIRKQTDVFDEAKEKAKKY